MLLSAMQNERLESIRILEIRILNVLEAAIITELDPTLG